MGFLTHLRAAGSGAIVCLLLSSFAPLRSHGPLRRLSPQRLLYNETVLPPNFHSQRLATVTNPYYGIHVFALGKNGSLWHKFQTGPPDLNVSIPFTPMSPWHCLTPNASLTWSNEPAAAVNRDGHIEIFVGLGNSSTQLWQMYQSDPKDPLSWSAPRAPACSCGPEATECPQCKDCSTRPDCMKNYWIGSEVITTSDAELRLDQQDQKLKLYFRNSDGHMYELSQEEPNKSEKWAQQSIQLATFE